MPDMLLQDATIVVTGAKGVGKTFFAATYAKPSQVELVFYHDSERSANRVVQSMAESGLAFGHYGDLSARFSDLPSEEDLLALINKGSLPWLDKKQKSALRGYYEYVLEDLDHNLTRGQYKVYVMDTLEKLEAGMAAWCEDHISEWGYTSMKRAMQYGRFWSDAVYSLYEQLVAAIFARGVETIILCSHLKTPWRDDKPVPGKVTPGGKKLLHRLSSLMIWLVSESGNADGAPAGLILKERMGDVTPDPNGDGWVAKTNLPRRIPHCTWGDIRRYMAEGCDMANPQPGETMSQYERDTISELLTDKQMQLMILDAQKDLEQKRGMAEERVVPPEGTVALPATQPFEHQGFLDAAVAMRERGVSDDEIRADIVGTFPPPLRGTRGAKVAEEVLRRL